MNMCTEDHSCKPECSCKGYRKHRLREITASTEAWLSGFQMRMGIYIAYIESMLCTLEMYPDQEKLRSEKTTPAMIGMAHTILEHFQSSPPCDNGKAYKDLTAEEKAHIDPFLNRLNNAIQAVINFLTARLAKEQTCPESLSEFLAALKIAEKRCQVYEIQFGLHSRQYKAAKATFDQLCGRVRKRK